MSTLRLLLGFDYGTKQIGVAVGQAVTGQARELCVLKAQNGVPDWTQIEALLREWQPDALVVGLPYNMDDTEAELAARARRFGRRHGHVIDEHRSIAPPWNTCAFLPQIAE